MREEHVEEASHAEEREARGEVGVLVARHGLEHRASVRDRLARAEPAEVTRRARLEVVARALREVERARGARLHRVHLGAIDDGACGPVVGLAGARAQLAHAIERDEEARDELVISTILGALVETLHERAMARSITAIAHVREELISGPRARILEPSLRERAQWVRLENVALERSGHVERSIAPTLLRDRSARDLNVVDRREKAGVCAREELFGEERRGRRHGPSVRTATRRWSTRPR